MLCTRCKKNTAVMFITRMENGKAVNESLCMPCAKELGIGNIDKLMENMDPEMMANIDMQMNEIMNDADLDTEDIGGSVRSLINNIFSGGGKETDSEQKKEKKQKTKEDKRIIDLYGENLTKKAFLNKLDRVVGRDTEIERMIQILNRRTKNNPALIGEPGVGKTAVAEGLAGRINAGDVPVKLRDKEVYLLDFTAIVAGTQYRGQFEARLKSIVDEVKRLGNIILVIDELHNIVGAGDAEGAMSAANILKPALARGDIQVIGATTLAEYRKYIEKDSALERRFQPIIVEEPSVAETIEILKGIREYYENYHHVKITDEVIEKAAVLSERYITDRFLPDKAIDLIDEAGSRANLRNKALGTIYELKKQLELIQKEKDSASEGEETDFSRTNELELQEYSIKQSIDRIYSEAEDVYLTVDDIATVIQLQTKIPVKKLTEEEAERLLKLEDNLHKRIIGQDEAVSAVGRTIRRKRASFAKKKRPASFIFVGPTGVGKTETVKALSDELFGSEEALIRVDMTEYMEKHALSKLIGSPPGYVGYDDAGQLTEKVRRKPYSVILFDEIEKAHPDVMNILLQILDDGRVTDSHGKVVSFENTVIVMTSNAGSGYTSSALGFSKTAEQESKTRATEALKKFLRPEFLNRVDEIVVFDPLTKENLLSIVDLMTEEINSVAKERGMRVVISDEVKKLLCDKGYDAAMGARPLRRTVSREIEDRLAEMLLRGERPTTVEFVDENGEIALKY